MKEKKSKKNSLRLWLKNLKSIHLFISVIFMLGIVHFSCFNASQRKLIKYDDIAFIAPLEKISIVSYFTEYLVKKNTYAFPLRDLTFILDFKISELIGINVFWISNFIYFSCTLWFLFQIYQLYLPLHYSYLALLLTAFHPVQVEVIQWASIRKHILVALFISIATLKVLKKIKLGKKIPNPTVQDWAAWITLYACSLLCWPTACFWIFWLMWVFRKKIQNNIKNFLVILLPVGLLFSCVIGFTLSNNDGFMNNMHELKSFSNFLSSFSNFSQSIGRGVFNLLLPIWIAPYYSENNWKNWLGIIFLALPIIYLIKYNFLKLDSLLKENSIYSFLILAVFLFIPSSFIFFNKHEFLWADRYNHVMLPYLILFSFLSILNVFPHLKKIKWTDQKKISFGLFFLFFIIKGHSLTKYWNDDFVLMDYCSKTEQSPHCIALAIEKSFDLGGCGMSHVYFPLARQIYQTKNLSINDPRFKIETPFYEGLCIALVNNLSFSERQKQMEEVEKLYQVPSSFYFPKILSLLQDKKIDEAYRLMDDYYFKLGIIPATLTSKLINVFEGQIESLCLVSMDKAEFCKEELVKFNKRFSYIEKNEEQKKWAVNLNLFPFNTSLQSSKR